MLFVSVTYIFIQWLSRLRRNILFKSISAAEVHAIPYAIFVWEVKRKYYDIIKANFFKQRHLCTTSLSCLVVQDVTCF
jgi:hypothetical protein